MNSINPHLHKILRAEELVTKDADYYIHGIIEHGDFLILAEAITLLESDHLQHKILARQILIACEKIKVKSRRIGITGSPGVGKSTFIEHIVPQIKKGREKAAILTIDPSSIDNRGSILGDKTRMDLITKDDHIFIRPSPSRSHLGGVHAMTYEAMVMCEAAGIDHIIVETVGVGQSEYEISSIVDCTILLLLPGSGDDLQGIKKGITQIADLIVINKADGERLSLAQKASQDYQTALHIANSNDDSWSTPVCLHSSIDPIDNSDLFIHLEEYFKFLADEDRMKKKRRSIKKQIVVSRVHLHLQQQLNKILKSNRDINKYLEHENVFPYQTINDIVEKSEIDIKWL